MSDDIQIIKLQPDQWQMYRDLRLKALKEEPQAYLSTYAENSTKPDNYWKERLIDVDKGRNWLVFAKSGDILVGMMGAFKKQDETEDIVNIIAVYVVSEARGRGISKLLLEKLISEISQDIKIKKIKLSVNSKQIPALKLYESFGFKITGEEYTKLGDGKYYTELFMEKEIYT
jgi:ribosomal protein S18 acetylase RimI-like enzyme